jgi:hypothetical protein
LIKINSLIFKIISQGAAMALCGHPFDSIKGFTFFILDQKILIFFFFLKKKVRLQTSSKYNGMFNAIKRMINEEGVKFLLIFYIL